MADETGECADLRELLQLAGWGHVCAYIDQTWGPEACLEKIDRALQALQPGDVEAERQTVLQIRAAAKQMQALKTWPVQRMRELAPQKSSSTTLDRLRRIAR